MTINELMSLVSCEKDQAEALAAELLESGLDITAMSADNPDDIFDIYWAAIS